MTDTFTAPNQGGSRQRSCPLPTRLEFTSGLARVAANVRHGVVIAATLLAAAEGSAAPQHFGTLVRELADRNRLAVHPDGTYTQHQASSYDRLPTPLGAPTSFANADTANFLRTITVGGQTEYVMMEDTGPGALTRWWMTGDPATDGEIRVYIDGSASPVLQGQIESLISGSSSQFGSALSFQSRPGIGSGHNLYAPIPYAESILVTYRGQVNQLPGWDPPVYYGINYRKYHDAVGVTSYTSSDPTNHHRVVSNTGAALSNPTVSGNVTETHSVSGSPLNAGAAVSHELVGTAAIRRLSVRVNGADQAAALRDTYVELVFDGVQTARVPVTHFFGNGDAGEAAIHPFVDFYRRVEADGKMTSYWVMPFQNAAKVRLVNDGPQNVTVDFEIDSGGWQWDENSMHFHADYRAEQNIATRAANGTADWTYLNVRGRGVFVGDSLSIRNRAHAWWGEGDEKVYVDYLDEDGIAHGAQPVHIGTGTEDYYGYAWSHPETFSSPFVSQPTGAGNLNPGVSVNSRVRALDAIPFQESFKFDMELWHWHAAEVDLGATSYWYGSPGAVSLQVAADLAVDYRPGHDFAEGGLPDLSGDGQWLYLSSSTANPADPRAETSPLTFGAVGNAGNEGYGGGQNGHNLAAISDEFLFVDGWVNQGVQGSPGYHELALHPAGNVAGGGFAGNADQPYVVARWIAGQSSAGLANVTGSVRNFIDGSGDSVDFQIYVDSVLKFAAVGTDRTLAESHFEFDAMIAEGSMVDFVLGNGGEGNLFGDETLLRAIIYAGSAIFAPLPGDFNGDGTVDAADYTVWRDGLGDTFDVADYIEWKQNFGATAASGATFGHSSHAAVPEPASLMMLLVGAAMFFGRRLCRFSVCAT